MSTASSPDQPKPQPPTPGRGRTAKTVAAAAAAGALALGAGLGIANLASADPTGSPSSPGAAAPYGGYGPGRDGHGPGGHRGGQFNGDLAKQLADKLGVSESKVSSALQEFRDSNQADRPNFDPNNPPTQAQREAEQAKREAALAKSLAAKLNVSEAKVTKALADIRADHQKARAAELKDRLDAAVKAGTLTQAEADAVTKAIEKGVIHG